MGTRKPKATETTENRHAAAECRPNITTGAALPAGGTNGAGPTPLGDVAGAEVEGARKASSPRERAVFQVEQGHRLIERLAEVTRGFGPGSAEVGEILGKMEADMVAVSAIVKRFPEKRVERAGKAVPMVIAPPAIALPVVKVGEEYYLAEAFAAVYGEIVPDTQESLLCTALSPDGTLAQLRQRGKLVSAYAIHLEPVTAVEVPPAAS